MAIVRVEEYWVDNRNNKWSAERCSKEEAEKYSASLIDCNECEDCRFCNRCYDCNDCYNCTYCSDCRDCNDCTRCRSCINCSNCADNTGCVHCIICTYCSDCRDCYDCDSCVRCKNCSRCGYCKKCRKCADCRDCTSFYKNPERIVGEKIRQASYNPIVYWVKAGKEQCLIGGCSGTLVEAEKALEEEYKDNLKLLAYYRKFVRAVRAYQKIMEKDPK